MVFNRGDMVVFNEDYILNLYRTGQNVEYSGIEDVIRHIENGNKPMELKTANNYKGFGVIDYFQEYGNCFSINLKEVRYINRKIRRIK